MSYPVINVGQAAPSMVALKDFNTFYDYALAQANALADVARAHGLTSDEENQVRRLVGNIEQYTIPMASCPTPPPAPSPAPTAAAAPAVQSQGIPWWAAGLVGLGVGALIVSVVR